MRDMSGVAEHEDLGVVLGRALEAARRGEMDVLERELVRLRQLKASGLASVGAKLRGLARSVRAHPSCGTAMSPETRAG